MEGHSCSTSCGFDTTQCFKCGDGTTNQGEMCDGSDLASKTCQTEGFAKGTLTCSNCSFDASSCSTCGDQVIDSGESCDGNNLNGTTCQLQGFDFGAVSCRNNCRLDARNCSKCSATPNTAIACNAAGTSLNFCADGTAVDYRCQNNKCTNGQCDEPAGKICADAIDLNPSTQTKTVLNSLSAANNYELSYFVDVPAGKTDTRFAILQRRGSTTHGALHATASITFRFSTVLMNGRRRSVGHILSGLLYHLDQARY